MIEQLRADWREVNRLRLAVRRLNVRIAAAKPAVARLTERDPQFAGVLPAVRMLQVDANALSSLLDPLSVPPELVEEVR